ALPLMVRIRKNADALTPDERDRFLRALAALNHMGAGPFQIIRGVHDRSGYLEAHQERGFLAWHRAYLLDFERRLQELDASVALPYWRFDRGAPNVFHVDFMGESDANNDVHLSPTNPLDNKWVGDNGVVGIVRAPDVFDPKTGGAVHRSAG